MYATSIRLKKKAIISLFIALLVVSFLPNFYTSASALEPSASLSYGGSGNGNLYPFYKLEVAGTGKEEDPYRPILPLKIELDNIVDWGAWYYPDKPPYEYCIVQIYKFKDLQKDDLIIKGMDAINKLTIENLQKDYSTYYKVIFGTGEASKLGIDPPPESWNFDSDAVGSTPSGWTIASGTMSVQNDSYVSAYNSFKLISGTCMAYAGANRTNFTLKADVATECGSGGEARMYFRYINTNNHYGLGLTNTGGLHNVVRFTKRVSGTYTVISSVTSLWNLGQFYELKVITNGTYAKGFLNGTQLLPVTGWLNLGSDFAWGYVGVGISTPSWYDNIYIEDYGVIQTEFTYAFSESLIVTGSLGLGIERKIASSESATISAVSALGIETQFSDQENLILTDSENLFIERAFSTSESQTITDINALGLETAFSSIETLVISDIMVFAKEIVMNFIYILSEGLIILDYLYSSNEVITVVVGLGSIAFIIAIIAITLVVTKKD